MWSFCGGAQASISAQAVDAAGVFREHPAAGVEGGGAREDVSVDQLANRFCKRLAVEDGGDVEDLGIAAGVAGIHELAVGTEAERLVQRPRTLEAGALAGGVEEDGVAQGIARKAERLAGLWLLFEGAEGISELIHGGWPDFEARAVGTDRLDADRACIDGPLQLVADRRQPF